MERVGGLEWADLIRKVFSPGPRDRAMAFLVDLPDGRAPDRPEWAARRAMVGEWRDALEAFEAELGLEARLFVYRNTGAGNAELPERAWEHRGGALPASADELDPSRSLPFAEAFTACSILVAPTQFSATAPLKILARRYGFRAVTMPGFDESMIPALRLDYGVVMRRCVFLKELLERSVEARIDFLVDGSEPRRLALDLRHRSAHASGGLVPEPGTTGNLPSGEAYIAPYEGELSGDASRSAGDLPVQLGDEVVVYRIEANRAVEASGPGAAAAAEAGKLRREPAYGNIAELGLGVLADLGIGPVGKTLLDEKLGLHIGFGRSDHLGGSVGPSAFSSREAATHLDRVYVPAMQDRVRVAAADLVGPDGSVTPLMRDGAYALSFTP